MLPMEVGPSFHPGEGPSSTSVSSRFFSSLAVSWIFPVTSLNTSSEEKGASLTDKLLPDSGRPLWPGVVPLTGQLADRQRLLLFAVKSQE